MNSAPAPEAKGEPATGERLPVEPTEKAETVPDPELVTNANAVVWAGGVVIIIMRLLPGFEQLSIKIRREAKVRKVKAGTNLVARIAGVRLESIIVHSPEVLSLAQEDLSAITETREFYSALVHFFQFLACSGVLPGMP